MFCRPDERKKHDFHPTSSYVISSKRKEKAVEFSRGTKGETIVRFHIADNKKNCTHELHIFCDFVERKSQAGEWNKTVQYSSVVGLLIVRLVPAKVIKRHGIQLIFQCFFMAF